MQVFSSCSIRKTQTTGLLLKHLATQFSSNSHDMARIAGLLICILIVIMDVVAGILGIEAEVAQNKGKHLRVLFFECKEPVHQAYILGLAAAILLALAHGVVNLLGGCVCVRSKEEFARSSTNKQLAVSALVLSWIALAVGFILLIVGALSNSKSRSSCGFPHRHFLSVGGIVCFIHGLLSVAYYASATAASWEEDIIMARDVKPPQQLPPAVVAHHQHTLP